MPRKGYYCTMSDPVQLALIAAVVSVCGLVVNAFVAVKTFRRMGVLEKQTNSIKDALVKVTGEEAYERGKRDEKSDNPQRRA